MTNAPRSLFARAGAVGRRTAVGAAVVAATLALVAAPAMAAGPTAYRNIPSTIAGNIGSIAFQARSISEFGDLIQLGGTERSSAKLPVTVVMSIWACQTGGDVTCDTTPGATWNQNLTLTIYAADTTGAVPIAVVPPLLTKTQSFALPYRPSRDATGHCDASGFYPWYSVAENTCFNGLAHPVTFSLPAGVTLPDQLIWSISFNTETHGYAPIGKSGPWNSLNVAAKTYSGEPTVGTDVEPQAAFVNSTWNGAYGDNGAGGLGTFRYDPTGWAAIAPLVCFGYCPINSAAATPTPFDSVLAATAPPYWYSQPLAWRFVTAVGRADLFRIRCPGPCRSPQPARRNPTPPVVFRELDAVRIASRAEPARGAGWAEPSRVRTVSALPGMWQTQPGAAATLTR